jgi:hypothetical protein
LSNYCIYSNNERASACRQGDQADGHVAQAWEASELNFLWTDDASVYNKFEIKTHTEGATTMSKAQDSKKAVKKEPLKSPKEKKEAKKVKKEAMKRQ